MSSQLPLRPELEQHVAPEDAFTECSGVVRQDRIVIHKAETTIGRDETCDVCIDDGLISRRHARFLLKGDSLYLEDLASTNGTFVNGRRLHGVWPVHPGEAIALGHFELWLGRAKDGKTLLLPSPQGSPTSGIRPGRVSTAAPAANDEAADGPISAWSAAATKRRLSAEVDAVERLTTKKRMLEEYMGHLRASLNAGQPVPYSVLHRASHYALRFAHISREPVWLDRTLELHILAGESVCEKVMQQIVALNRAGVACAPALLSKYFAELDA